MALPTRVETAMSKVRAAAQKLSDTNFERERARRSGDEDRMKRSEETYKEAARKLQEAAKSLADAARHAQV